MALLGCPTLVAAAEYDAEVVVAETGVYQAGKQVAVLSKTDPVHVFDTAGDWVLVKTPDSDRQGWVTQSSIAPVGIRLDRHEVGLYQSLIQRGKDHLASGKVSDSIEAFREAANIGERLLGDHSQLHLGGLVLLARAYASSANRNHQALADTTFRDAIERAERVLGSHSNLTGVAINDYAILCKRQGRMAKALTNFERALEITLVLPDRPAMEIAESHMNLAAAYQADGQLDHARVQYENVIKAAQQPNAEVVVLARQRLNELKSQATFEGRYPVEVPRVLAEVAGIKPGVTLTADIADFDSIIEQVCQHAKGFEPISWDTLLAKLNSQLRDEWKPGRGSDALFFLTGRVTSKGNEARDIVQRIHGLAPPTSVKEQRERSEALLVLYDMAEDPPARLVKQLSLIASAATMDGDHLAAAQALHLAASLAPEDEADTRASVMGCGGLLAGFLGKNVLAAQCYQRSLILNYIAAKRWENLIESKDAVEDIRSQLSDATDGQPANIMLKTFVEFHDAGMDPQGQFWPLVIDSGSELAAKQANLGQFRPSLKTLETMERIAISEFAADDLALAKLYTAKSLTSGQLGEFEMSRVAIEQAIRVQTQAFPQGSQSLAQSLASQARNSKQLGRPQDAVRQMQQATEMYEALLGPSHPQVSIARAEVGAYRKDAGDFAQAEQELTRSIDELRQSMGDSFPDLIPAYVNLGEAQAGSGNAHAAKNSLQTAMRKLVAYSSHELPKLSEQKQLSYLAFNPKAYLRRALQSLYPYREQPDIAEAMLELAFNTRGLILTSVAARQASDATPTWTPANQLDLDDGEAIVMLHRGTWNLGHGSDDKHWIDRMLAFVQPDSGETVVVDLGDAADIISLIQQTRESLVRPEDATAAHAAAARLGQAILPPIKRAAPAACRWLVQPDGAFWSVPLECLVDRDGKFLVETHEVVYFSSPIGWKQESRDTPGSRSALLVANPAFSATVGQPSADGNPLIENLGLPNHWPTLPGTQAELKLSLSGLAKFLQKPRSDLRSDVLLGDQATEARVRDVESPYLLNIASHGYFLSRPKRRGLGAQFESVPGGLKVKRLVPGGPAAQQVVLQSGDIVSAILHADGTTESLNGTLTAELADLLPNTNMVQVQITSGIDGRKTTKSLAIGDLPGPSVLSKGDLTDNPFQRCGLALAGADHAAQCRPDADGVLTGVEILSMNLAGTEVVCLSACETGLGDDSKLEGAVGLRHAFQVAGARNVISTLWQIPDQATALLMSEFWTRCGNGESVSEALTNAKRDLIDRLKDQSGAAHPFFWAAATVTGH
ncbi:MAG: CHAT domain-containing protein [Planctomycetota bacterium]